MNLEQLKSAGAFISAEPVKCPVVWKDQNFDVYVRRLSFGDVENLSTEGSNATALLAAAILLGDDKTPLTAADAQRLDASLAMAFLGAINSVNSGVDEKN